MKRLLVLLLLMIFLCFISSQVMAFEVVKPEEKPSKYSIGLEISYPLSTGLSGLYNIGDTWAVQAIIGIPETVCTITGVKVLYRFSRKEERNVYLYGLTGKFAENSNFSDTPETVTGASLGVGIEYSPYSTPDLKNSVEFGYAKIPFSDINYSFMVSYGMRIYF